MKTWLISFALLVPAFAHADNTDCLDAADAVVHGREIVTYCESCGDQAPGLPHVAAGDIRDPLHTYVRIAPDRFENLALLAGCAAEFVPPTLTQEVATPDGVLIYPSNEPLARHVDSDREDAAAPPGARGWYYTTTNIYSMPWLAIAGAAGGVGLVVGALLVLVVGGLRRRRAMEPRASKLFTSAR